MSETKSTKKTIELDKERFGNKLDTLLESWKTQNENWQGTTAIVIPTGEAPGDIRYWKSSSLFLWMLGYEFTDTILVFTETEFHALAGQKKLDILQQLEDTCISRGMKLRLHLKTKGEGGVPQMKELMDIIKSKENPIVGTLPKEKPTGAFAEAWSGLMSASDVPLVDISKCLGSIMCTKDQKEILNVKKASFLLANAMNKKALKEIEETIDQEKKVSHSRLADMIESVISEPSKIEVKLKKEMVDIAYPPLIESGGHYTLKLSGLSTNSNMDYGVIVCQAGARYASYCANIGRTYFVNPTKEKEAKYAVVFEAHSAAIQAMTEGQKASDVYEAARQIIQEKGGEAMIARMPKSIGTAIGLEIRDNTQSLSSQSHVVLKAGMAFSITLGFKDLVDESAEDEQRKSYAILLSDTVIVPENGKAPEVLTLGVPKDWRDIAYYLKDEEESDIEEQPATEIIGVRKSARTEQIDFKAREEERRRQKENQEELLERVNQATLSILDKSSGAKSGVQGSGRQASSVVSYKSVQDVRQVHHYAIQVDNKHESVLLPIYGILVPFHILMIKNASATQENEHHFIRINFNFGTSWEPGALHPKSITIKEMSFRTANAHHATSIVRDIKTLKSLIQQRDKEKAERATLVKQEKLIHSKSRVHSLKEIWMRPAFAGKGRKVPGQLDAHVNGFRYRTPKGEEVDVMYRNIKHAFFQPAENDMVTLVHLHLINPIMIGKKKTVDVQFYTQVMDTVQTLDAGRRSMYDPDEIEEEQRERERRNQINRDFSQFIKRVQQDIWEKDYGDLNLEFEIPFRELGFYGVPSRATSFVMPTVNCLVELTEMPFTVITLSEVNLVNLERVGFNLRNFDMIFVWKDLNKEVARIDTIPSQSLETIKDWLTSIEMKFFESKVNLNWKNILKSIKEDPEAFIESGGWSFLDADQTDSEDEAAEEESDFEPSDDDDAGESEDIDSSDESVVESDDEDFDEEDEEDEEGLDWDELELQARREDREKGYSDSDDEERRKKKARR